jgi:hypothetical protein
MNRSTGRTVAYISVIVPVAKPYAGARLEWKGTQLPAPLALTAIRIQTQIHVKFEVFTAVTMKNGIYWDVTLCGS